MNTPIEQISEAFELKGVWSADQLLADSVIPYSVLAIDGLESVDDASKELWSGFFSDIIRETKTQGYATSRFIGILSPRTTCPQSDSHFVKLPWWGRLSRSDVEIAIRSELGGSTPDSPVELLWIECISRGCAVTRPELVQRLANEAPRTSTELMALLSDVIPDDAGGGDNPVRGYCSLLPVFDPPPEAGTKDAVAWDLGTLDWHDSLGLVWMDPTGSDPATGNPWLQGALSRGQRETLLPVVERVRATLDSWLVSRFGEYWDNGLEYGDGQYEVERREGIQGLANLVRELDRAGTSVPRLVLDVLYRWKRIRNVLAHNSIVDFDALEEAVALYDRFCRTHGRP